MGNALDREDIFATYKAQGDGLGSLGICDGDELLLAPAAEIRAGGIYVLSKDGAAHVLRAHDSGAGVLLANTADDPPLLLVDDGLPEGITLVGRVAGLYRLFPDPMKEETAQEETIL